MVIITRCVAIADNLLCNARPMNGNERRPVLVAQAAKSTEGADDQAIFWTTSTDGGVTWSNHTVAVNDQYAVWGPVLHYDTSKSLMYLVRAPRMLLACDPPPGLVFRNLQPFSTLTNRIDYFRLCSSASHVASPLWLLSLPVPCLLRFCHTHTHTRTHSSSTVCQVPSTAELPIGATRAARFGMLPPRTKARAGVSRLLFSPSTPSLAATSAK